MLLKEEDPIAVLGILKHTDAGLRLVAGHGEGEALITNMPAKASSLKNFEASTDTASEEPAVCLW